MNGDGSMLPWPVSSRQPMGPLDELALELPVPVESPVVLPVEVPVVAARASGP